MVFERSCQYVHKDGRVCGKPFRTGFHNEVLCRRCRRRLPKCGTCRIVMGRRYGYMEDGGRRLGLYKICGSCGIEVRRKRYLRISEEKCLLATGKVVITRKPRPTYAVTVLP